MNPIERRLAIAEHKAALKELESNKTENMNLANSRRIQEKFAASKARNEAAAAAIAQAEIQRLAAAKVTAAASPVAAKAPPAPLAPKAPAPTVATITAAEFVASANSEGPGMTRSEFNKLTGRQKKRLADMNGRIVPEAAAPAKAKAKSKFDHLSGLARAQAAAKHEAAEKAKSAAL